MEHSEALGEDVMPQTKRISEACPPFKKISKKLPGRKQRLLKKIKELQEDCDTTIIHV